MQACFAAEVSQYLLFFLRGTITPTETIRLITDREPRTATSTFTQLLSSVSTRTIKLKDDRDRPTDPRSRSTDPPEKGRKEGRGRG